MSHEGLKLKVCGMKFKHNMLKVAQLRPDYLGFIFYKKSPRYMADTLTPDDLRQLPRRTRKVGVFVNEDTKAILAQARAYRLDMLQLHGDESHEQCKALKQAGQTVVKAFSIGQGKFDFDQLEAYKPYIKYFLFDTKGKQRGGNGETFDWSQLRQYDQEIPFFLSGGIDMENVKLLKSISHLNIYAIDVNSRFEVEPGIKDIHLLQLLKDKMRTKP